MAKRKCKFCGETVDEKAIICTNCGTNQKSGKSLRAHNAPKRMSFIKKITLLLLLGAFIFGAYYFSRRYRSQISNLKSSFTQKITSITKSKQEEQVVLSKETRNFPIDIVEAENAGKYHINISGGSNRFKRKIDSSKRKIWTAFPGLNIKILAPDKTQESLRVKIYRGAGIDGEYELVYDQSEKVKLQKEKINNARLDSLKRMSERYNKMSPLMKKKYLEAKKRAEAFQKRIKRIEEKKKASLCALFKYRSKGYTLPPGQQDIYFRILLYDSNGRIIKQHRPYRVEMPQQISSGSSNYKQNYFTEYKEDEDAIYPCFYPDKLSLYFDFRQKKAFEVVSMRIDGVKYIPNFGRRDYSTTRIDRKTRKRYSRYRSVLKLNYPFGGNVTMKIKVRSRSGKFKRIFYKFYLPSPPPILYKKFVDGKSKINIYWNSIEKFFPEKYYSRQPSLILSRNDREIAKFNSLGSGIHEVKDIQKGEVVTYNLTLRNGETNNIKWTSKGGLQNCKVGFLTHNSKMSRTTAILPDAKRKRAIRLEYVKSSLVFENTGIPTMKLLNRIISRIKDEKSIVAYDTDARDYVIDEKIFAMSGELRKKFALKESDFSFQIRDYSRADGKGLEIWLFKREMTKQHGHSGIKGKTKFWKLASVKLDSDESEFDKAADLLISAIKEKFDFYICPDARAKKIKPRKIICKNFRPLNQDRVIWNYKAISETFSLQLGENNKDIKILSKEDWDLVINERLSANHKGYDIIDNNDRELLLTGRMWRDGKKKCFFIKACDAFSGEILATKIFKGRIPEIAEATSRWCETLRVADDIKVDFEEGLFTSHWSRQYRQPWRIKTDYLARYGPVFEAPKKKFRANTVRRKFSSLEFARRQWKDGFRNKAVEVLEDAWKKKKDFSVAITLLGYYQTLNSKHKGLALCNELMTIDDCPEEVLGYYRSFKYMKTNIAAAASDSYREKQIKKAEPVLQQWGTGQNWINGKFDEMFYIDRDFISPEWCPDGKYRTILLSMKLDTKEISKYLLAPRVINNGIFYNVKAFGFYPGMVYQKYNRKTKKYETQETKRKKGEYTVVSLAGWNSVTPFSTELSEELLYTRTANLFPREFAGSFPEKLYVVSKIRAIMELKDNLKLPIPNYSSFRGEKKFNNAYTYLKKLVTGAQKEMKREYGKIDLAQYLAIDILAKVHDKDALDLYEKSLKVKIPASHKEWLKMKYPYKTGDFIVFRAYKGDRSAQKYLSENSIYLENHLTYGERKDFDIIFPLLKKLKSDLLFKVAVKNGGKRGLYALRWARKISLKNALLKYSDILPGDVATYLIMGTRHDSVAWTRLKGQTLMQYFGKPENEIYIDFRQRHFDRIAKLKTKAVRK